jgi:hypothetical protein
VLLVFAYFGWIMTVIGAIAVAIEFQPLFGSKLTHNDVSVCTLISIV